MPDLIPTPGRVEFAHRVAARVFIIAGGQTGFEDMHPLLEDLWKADLAEVHRPTPLRDQPSRDDYWRLTAAGDEWLSRHGGSRA